MCHLPNLGESIGLIDRGIIRLNALLRHRTILQSIDSMATPMHRQMTSSMLRLSSHRTMHWCVGSMVVAALSIIAAPPIIVPFLDPIGSRTRL